MENFMWLLPLTIQICATKATSVVATSMDTKTSSKKVIIESHDVPDVPHFLPLNLTVEYV